MSFKIKKILLILPVISLIFALNVAPASAYVDYKTLDIPPYSQEESNWCWAATSQIVIDYIGYGFHTQDEIVEGVKGSVVNETANQYEDKESLTDWGVSTSLTTSYITFATIITNIKNYEPIKAFRLLYETTGHDFLIYGFYEYTDISQQDVYYFNPDPYSDSYYITSYNTFKTNWKFTLYNNR